MCNRLLHRTEDQLRNQSFSCVYNLPVKPKTEEPERRRKKEGTLKDFQDRPSQNTKTEEQTIGMSNLASSSESSKPTDTNPPFTIDDQKPDELETLSTSSMMNDPKPGGSGMLTTRPTILEKIPKDKEKEPLFNINDVQFVSRLKNLS